MKGNASAVTPLAFGSFGIKTLELSGSPVARLKQPSIAVTRYMQRQGQIWIRASSPTSPSPRSLPKSAWVKVRVIRKAIRLRQ